MSRQTYIVTLVETRRVRVTVDARGESDAINHACKRVLELEWPWVSDDTLLEQTVEGVEVVHAK